MKFQVIAGPCAVDESINELARDIAGAGATVLKGGCFKPLTWPPSLRKPYQVEPGIAGLDALQNAASKYNLPWMSEAMQTDDLEYFGDFSNSRTQIGARNQQNFKLLQATGEEGRPVMLKRHFGCSLEELYASVCYLKEFGVEDVWACERGVVAPHHHGCRYLLDLQAVVTWDLTLRSYAQDPIPMIVDVSHWIGTKAANEIGHKAVVDCVFRAAKAAKAMGANGIYVDVHHNPAKALVDPYQAITPEELGLLVEELT